jgi:ferritin-like metal-binding protein YciE
MAKTPEEHLVNYLTDAYSIEQQALAQLRTAPDIAGEPTLAGHFRDHLTETERQADLVHQRLEAHGGSPKRVKDAVMALGGKGFLLFARSQPDTPGKLAAHAHSYEALEWASYEMLIRMAERAGDADTAAVARAIRDEERTMMDRIAATFDAAADASVHGKQGDDLRKALERYLADAHALEEQSIQLLEKAPDLAGDPELERLYRQHLDESRSHARLIEARLEQMGGGTSAVKDAALRLGGLEWGLFFQAQTDTPGKLAAFAYAVENLEIAGYELLRRVAERAGDAATVELAGRILGDERAMADRVAAHFDRAFEASMAEKGVAVG